jgi:hypothetical protein
VEELGQVIAGALGGPLARDYFRSAALFPKAASELRTAAVALERIQRSLPAIKELHALGQKFAVIAAVSAVFGERDAASKLHAADEESQWRVTAMAYCLNPAVLPGGLRALADQLECLSSAIKGKRGRPAGSREFARRLASLSKLHIGKPHHREAAKLYSAIIGRNISPANFARLARN